jgi:hypothetical protein
LEKKGIVVGYLCDTLSRSEAKKLAICVRPRLGNLFFILESSLGTTALLSGDPQPHSSIITPPHTPLMMITREDVQACNMGRGAYDTTDVPKPTPQPPKPR